MAQGEGGGRPTKYDPKLIKQVYKLCLLGSNNVQIADILDISIDTLSEWRKQYPKFSEAFKKGREEASSLVAESLFKRATGYSHPDIDIKVIEGKIIQTRLKKHYPPDTAAAIFYLKNKKPDAWRDKQEMGFTNKDGKDLYKTEAEIDEELKKYGDLNS